MLHGRVGLSVQRNAFIKPVETNLIATVIRTWTLNTTLVPEASLHSLGQHSFMVSFVSIILSLLRREKHREIFKTIKLFLFISKKLIILLFSKRQLENKKSSDTPRAFDLDHEGSLCRERVQGHDKK